jgi:hypothetical protein
MNMHFQTEKSIDTHGLQPGYSEIQLHRTELTKGLRTVPVGLNGRHASLPIGRKFGCPVELVQILNDAVRIEYERNEETDELEERRVHAYPFTIFATNPHTPESATKAASLRGFKGRPPREFWDPDYAERLAHQKAMQDADEAYQASEYDDE